MVERDYVPAVLVVEDNRVARLVVEEYLRKGGFDVEVAPTAEVALRVAGERPKGFDLLVADVLLPGSNGRDLAARIRASQPDLGVVFISGSDRARSAGDAEIAGERFVRKPFTAAELLKAVRGVLGDRGPGLRCGRTRPLPTPV